jgi:hypothetical protein
MSDNIVKLVGIVGVVIVLGVYFFWYMSPYQQCVRTLEAEGNSRPAVVCIRMLNQR